MSKIIKGIQYVFDTDYRFLHDSKKGKYDFLDDEEYLKRKYKAIVGHKLDLVNPKAFSEKMQWLKLYDRKPEYTRMVDKYEVKKFVSEILGEEYIIPTIGVYNKFDDIDFNALPNKFVIKCTHDSGGLIICRNKTKFDIQKAKKKIESCMSRCYFYQGREWPYKDVKPRIIIEQYVENEDNSINSQPTGLTDYKFFCFNKKAKMLYVSNGMENHSTAQMSFFDMHKNKLPFYRNDYAQMTSHNFPNNFDEMGNVAERLAKKIESPFVRIDLYSIAGQIKFSEITFTPCSGWIPFEPSEWDYKLGEWLELPVNKNNMIHN